MHETVGLVGLRQVHGMPAAGQEGRDASRRTRRHPQRVRDEPAVVCAGDRKQGGPKVGEPFPHRFLGPRPAQTQAGGQAGSGVAPALVQLCVVGRGESVEHRSAEPAIQEGIDVAGGLEFVRHRLVGLPALGPLSLVVDSGRATHEHQVVHRQPGAGDDVQGHPRPERVPDQPAGFVADRTSDCIGHEVGRRRQVGVHRVGARMTGQIDGQQRVCPGQQVAEASPRPRRLREAVQQHEWWAVASPFQREWHAG
jgi:hypothetical protein